MTVTLDDLSTQAAALQANADELTHRFEGLNEFHEAARWDADALAAIRLFERYKADLQSHISAEEQASHEAAAARSALPFHKRLVASRSAEKEHASNIAKANEGVSSVETVIAHLYELIDRTPSSKAEQKDMLSELRLFKKELATEKRSVNEAMRQVRTKARQDTASWTGIHGRGLVGSVARVERMQIRHQKEAALAPHESTKAAIERRLIETEMRINWVSKFRGEDPSGEKPPLRCAYCGRRVRPDAPCPGCGSDRTTRDL